MKHEIFEFNSQDMSAIDIFWRVVLLGCVLAVLLADLFYWRP